MSGIRTAPSAAGGDPIVATDTVGGIDYQVNKMAFGEAAELTRVSAANPMPVIDPDASSEVTLLALKASIDSLSAKIVACDTGGAATEITLGAVNDKLPALSGGRLPVELPAGGSGLTDAELRANPVPVSGSFSASVTPEDTATLMSALRALVHPIWEEAASGRLRVVLDPLGGAQTLGTVGTVTTVSTVTNLTTCAAVTSLNQMAGISAASFIYDQMHAAWANAIRPRIS